MNILIAGAKGFIGKNLCAQLSNIATRKARWYDIDSDITILEYDVDSTDTELDEYCRQADFVIDLNGATRLLDTLRRHGNTCPVLLASSSLATLATPSGHTKKAAEDHLLRYAEETGAKAYVYRLPEVFGKWCRPDADSEVSTLCYKVANDLPVQVSDPDTIINLVYIDDVVDEMINALRGRPYKEGRYCYVPNTYRVRTGDIVDLLHSFDKGRLSLQVPYVSDPFSKALYSTYVSNLPEYKISFPLKMNTDARGSFSEFIKTDNHGQISINISKPGITKGQHWHNNLVERFLVVSGHGLIQLRKIGNDEQGNPYPVISFEVSGDKLQVVEMIAGYTHNLINLSDTEDMVTIIWANDNFDPNRPDTYFEQVEEA